MENFQKQLYRYLLDYMKDKARAEVLANKESGAFESCRGILHRGLNVSDKRRLDVEAKVLNPRRAKAEKDILSAYKVGDKTKIGWSRPARRTRMTC